MPDGIYITRTEFNQLVKKIDFLEEALKSLVNVNQLSKWVPEAVAMEMIGVKARKLRQLRVDGKLIWKTSGGGRNIMVQRASIEKFIKENSNE